MTSSLLDYYYCKLHILKNITKTKILGSNLSITRDNLKITYRLRYIYTICTPIEPICKLIQIKWFRDEWITHLFDFFQVFITNVTRNNIFISDIYVNNNSWLSHLLTSTDKFLKEHIRLFQLNEKERHISPQDTLIVIQNLWVVKKRKLIAFRFNMSSIIVCDSYPSNPVLFNKVLWNIHY